MGDSVKTYDGSNLAIEQITVEPGRTTVYNFEVQEYHTYYVSNTKVLVHNSGPCPTGLKRMDKYGAAGAFKGKAGVYEHFYSNGDNIVSYTGKTTDLGGSRPGKSRRVRGRQAKEMDGNYEYMGSRYTTLEGSGFDDIYDLERAKLHKNIDEIGKENVFNEREPPKTGSK